MSLQHVHTEKQRPSGFTRWIRPRMENYIMRCCGCGLAHRMQFKVGRVVSGNVRGYYSMILLPSTRFRVMFRVQRAPRYNKGKP